MLDCSKRTWFNDGMVRPSVPTKLHLMVMMGKIYFAATQGSPATLRAMQGSPYRRKTYGWKPAAVSFADTAPHSGDVDEWCPRKLFKIGPSLLRSMCTSRKSAVSCPMKEVTSVQ